MRFDFDKNINDFLKIVVKCAKKHNINVYFVGGIVRDNLLNKKLSDIDITIDSNALEFVKLLPSEIKIKSLHNDFYTAKVEYKNMTVDIASTRCEHYLSSGSLPFVDCVGVDIRKDYLRRDFTINSMYSKIDIKDDELKYELIDFADGQNDLKNRVLRVLHNKSYIDDPTRILRGVNFKYRFDLDFSLNDKKLIDDYLSNIDIKNASIDRIIAVFRHVLSSKSAFMVLKDIVSNKYYKIINNSDLSVDFDKLSKIKGSAELYLKILLNEEVAQTKVNNELDIIRNFSKLNDDELNYYFYKTNDENVELYNKIKNIKLLISGNDLIRLGFKEGKKIGQILDELLLNKIKAPENFINKEQELNWVLKNKNL